jgi:hypothetical protein
MTARLHCLVPFCRRTCKVSLGFDEWICGPHWRAVSSETKAFRRAANRRLRKAIRAGHAIGACQYRAWQAWERCKAEAIERAAGIS